MGRHFFVSSSSKKSWVNSCQNSFSLWWMKNARNIHFNSRTHFWHNLTYTHSNDRTATPPVRRSFFPASPLDTLHHPAGDHFSTGYKTFFSISSTQKMPALQKNCVWAIFWISLKKVNTELQGWNTFIASKEAKIIRWLTYFEFHRFHDHSYRRDIVQLVHLICHFLQLANGLYTSV